MSAGPVSVELRAVLDAPRGRRFSRPGAATVAQPTREQRLLSQMAGNPRAAYRQTHGVLPHWMHLQAIRTAERGTWAPAHPREPSHTPSRTPEPLVPQPRPAPDDGPLRPRPRPERPPLPRRPRRPHSHRKPRRRGRMIWRLCGYTLTALAGALAHHLTPGLF